MNTIDILYVFSIIGILDTLYLLYHKIRGTDVACPFFPKEWCQKVQYSTYSKTFGVPNSVLGLIMYVLIFALTWNYVGGALALWPYIKILVSIGLAFSLYFLYIQAFVLRAFCTWCMVSLINFLVMGYAVWFMNYLAPISSFS